MRSCPKGMIYNTNTGECKCKPGLIEKNGKCEQHRIPKCLDGKVRINGKCVCPEGHHLQHGKCVKPLFKLEPCPPKSVRNKSKKCVCVRGYEMINDECIKKTKEKKPFLNRFTRHKVKPPPPRPLTRLTQKNPLENDNNSRESSFSDGLNMLNQMVANNSSKASSSKSSTSRSSSSKSSTKSPKYASFSIQPIKKEPIRLVIKPKTEKSPKNTLTVMKQECPKSLDCLLLSKHRQKIKDLFDDFKTFKSLKTVLPLRTESENANVLLLSYNYHEYETKAIMKLQKSSSADSLVYEYLTGLQVNQYLSYLPNFLETYALYETTGNKNVESIKDGFEYNKKSEDELLRQAVKEPTKNSLLIEYVHNSCKLESKLKDQHFIDNDLIPVLFQVYYALYTLKDKFAHYDLHTENVLLYEPYKGEYVRFRYHIDGNTYDFYSKYLVKLIDYGSSFTENSFDIYSKLCKIEKTCGKYAGFAVSNEEKISQLKLDYDVPNPSSDLKLLYQLKDNVDYDENDSLQELFDSLMKVKSQNKRRIIPPMEESGGNKINNVSDAYRKLLMLITSRRTIHPKRADLIIHGLNHRFEWIETSDVSNVETNTSSNVNSWSSSENEGRWD